jgi:hypothetical protein
MSLHNQNGIIKTGLKIGANFIALRNANSWQGGCAVSKTAEQRRAGGGTDRVVHRQGALSKRR